jgi:hypothetical protein
MLNPDDFPSASPQLIRMYNNRRPLSAVAADRAVAKVRAHMASIPARPDWTDPKVVSLADWNPERYRK